MDDVADRLAARLDALAAALLDAGASAEASSRLLASAAAAAVDAVALRLLLETGEPPAAAAPEPLGPASPAGVVPLAA